ncbi:MAG TPA: GTPase HflX, partial [Pseudoxanthomonas sp.]|nr:GTPase HflX [Pseudoxanthomonas sp.]
RHDHDGGAPDDPGHRERVWLSARDGRGMELLQSALAQRLDLQRAHGELRLSPQAGRLRARLHQLGAVRAEEADEHGWRLQVDLPRGEAERLAARADGEPLRALLPPRDPD